MLLKLIQNGKYLITADPRRGQISLIYNLPSSSSSSAAGGTLKFEWKDRRTRTVVESFNIITEDSCTFAPIPTGRDGERVYLLQFGSNTDRRFFFWMQDKFEPDVDDKHCMDMNKFLSNVNECIIAAGGEPPAEDTNSNTLTSSSTSDGGGSSAATTSTTTNNENENATNNTSTASSSSQQQQVEVLSNILENLGMPQPNNTSTNTASSSSNNASGTSSASTGALTLADLQGAMAGLATNSPVTASQQQQLSNNPTPPLTELASNDSINESGILENPEVVSHLMQYLPENQRTEEMLRENLRSPQVHQALHSLTLALVGESGDEGEGDGGNNMDSYHSIIANFQLNAEDGAAAMASGNPIQAFLDCLVASVKRDKEKKEAESKVDDQKE